MDFWWAFIYGIYLMKNLIWTNWPSIHEALVNREECNLFLVDQEACAD